MSAKNKLKEFKPKKELAEYVSSYWFFKNDTGEMINWPVVPDGCSDIIFYLKDSKKLGGLEDTFAVGIMEYAKLVPIQNGMRLFGIRFNPAVLYYLLKADMKKLANDMRELRQINNEIFQNLKIDENAEEQFIIASIETQLEKLFLKNSFGDNFLKVVKELKKNPQVEIKELSEKYSFSIKNLERTFYKRVGLAPKKFARIMRFQKAHNEISRQGMENLVAVALSSGYFDQAHFNREYKKLVGFSPSNETVSILYNK